MVGVDDILIRQYETGIFELWLVCDFVLSKQKIYAIVFDGQNYLPVSAKKFKEYKLEKIGEL